MVTVVGLGFVGLTTALGFAEYGHKVYGIEENSERLALINNGQIPFLEPDLDVALQRHLGKNFIPTADWETAVKGSDFIFYCVGTPLGEDGQTDLKYLFRALERTIPFLHDDRFRVLVTKSTIPPSTSQNRIIPYLREKGMNIPKQAGVANNPEFLREGYCWDDFIHADRIVLGVSDDRSEQMLRKLYEPSGVSVYALSLNTGEYIKYLSNTSLTCLISFANEMSIAADTIGDIDVSAAFRILHLDKRWQTGTIRSYFYPGGTYGGYCLPKDTIAFYATAKEAGYDCKILKHVIETNDQMPLITAEQIIRKTKNKNDCIGILGLSYKPGSDDVRGTPSALIIRELNKRGYFNILAYDPAASRKFQSFYKDLSAICLDDYDEIIKKADVLAITTAWKEFMDIHEKTSKPIVDCRNMF